MTTQPRATPDPETEFRRAGGPAWRHQMAMDFIASGMRPPANLDADVRDAIAFERRRREPGGVQRAEREFPVLAAVARAEEQDETAATLRLLTLAGRDHSTIAARLNISCEVLQAWEKTCFDIRPAMSAKGWIQARVIAPEAKSRGPEFAARARMAFLGGPGGATLALDNDAPLPIEGDDQLSHLKQRLAVQTEQAMAMPLTPGAEFKLFRLRLDIVKLENRLESARARLKEHDAKQELRVLQHQERVRTNKQKEKQLERIAAARDAKQASREAAKRGPSAEELMADQRRRREEAEARAAACPLSALRWDLKAPEVRVESPSLQRSNIQVVEVSLPEEAAPEIELGLMFSQEESRESELVCAA